MTKTRSQCQPNRTPQQPQLSSQQSSKICKDKPAIKHEEQKKVGSQDDAPTKGKSSTKSKCKHGKVEKREPTYNQELVNLSLIKKFDIAAVMDQTGNSTGDCHLPRATLNQIIKDSLPLDVRAQKESMDLICFASNAFIDLLSDISNNVCYKNNKKNIISEHTVRALQELHLDEFLPFLLCDDQNQKLQDILKQEKKNGLSITVKQLASEDKTQDQRDSVVHQILKRLSDSQLNGERRKKKNGAKLSGLTAEEMRQRQKELFDKEEQFDESEDVYHTEETPSNRVEGSASGSNQQPQQDTEQYWAEYKANWLSHNKVVLDQEYENWVKQNIEYNIQNHVPDGITDEAVFKQTFTAESFCESQYNQFLQVQFPPQQPVDDGAPAETNEAQQQEIATDQQVVEAEPEQQEEGSAINFDEM